MALQKQKDLDNGFSGDYWRIIRTDLYHQEKRAFVRMGLYKDKSLRQANPDGVIDVADFNFTDDEFAEFTTEEARSVGYKKITNLEEWQDAELI